MKRILINATQNEEIRVALCKGNHLYDFDLENRTREQKKSNIYKGHVTRVEPSLEAVFVEYGSQRQGFLPIREISAEYLSGNPRDENIKKLIKEGDELIVQVEKEERGNKGAALSTYVSLAGRYLVLMPNNPRGGGISRQISGKLRDDMKRMLGNLDLAKGMSVIIRTAGIGKTQEDLQHDLNHLLNIWQAIQEQNQKYPSPRLVHQEAGVVTRAVRDYLRDDISEIWIDNENAYIEAAGFIDAVMPTQADKLRKYTDYEPMFARFNVEKQIETAYQREVRLPSGGSIVIDQTEALVSIDINSAKSTKGSDVAETAYHTNLEAADEIARQLRLRDMGGLIVIDFIDMNDNKHQKEVEKRLIDATKYDRARVQFGEISKFGLMEMSRQRLRPSLEESTGYICPRCHGNGMIRDLRSLSLAIMRQIEQIALKERQGEVQAEVPTDIAAFILNEKRDSLVYLEQDSGTRITILPHAHLESPNFKLHFNRDGFAPTSYERITDTQQQEYSDLGYDVDWQTAEKERPEQQPTRQPRRIADAQNAQSNNRSNSQTKSVTDHSSDRRNHRTSENVPASLPATTANSDNNQSASIAVAAQSVTTAQPQAVAWLANLFTQAPQAQTLHSVSSRDAAEAIEALVNSGAQSLGSFGQVDHTALSGAQSPSSTQDSDLQNGERTQSAAQATPSTAKQSTDSDEDQKDSNADDRRKRKPRKSRPSKPRQRKDQRHESDSEKADSSADRSGARTPSDGQDKREQNNTRAHERTNDEQTRPKRKAHSQRSSRGTLERSETLTAKDSVEQGNHQTAASAPERKSEHRNGRSQDLNEVKLQVNEAPPKHKVSEVVHLSLDDSKPEQASAKPIDTQDSERRLSTDDKRVTAKIGHNDKAADSVEVATETTTPETRSSIDEKPSTNEQQPAAEDKAQDQKPASEPETVPAQTQSLAEEATTPTLNYESHKALFADYYVTADKFGQASNDPRVVRRQQLSSVADSSPQATTSILSTPATIRGTVGEFIHATLADAQSRLANQGIISCFIEAIEAHSQQACPATTAAADVVSSGVTSESDERFNFSNYGYEPLDADYLARFKEMTQAVSEFAAPQGMTEVEALTIGKRASNDPRGQHPDYKEQASQEPETAADKSQDEEVQDRSNLDVNSDAHNTEAHALTSEAQAIEVSNESEQLLEANQPSIDDSNDVDNVESAGSIKEDSQANKSKTTIASYKNMIENVAEQLLPQTGMFNLTTPKVPKARSRKPKIEHKKPTQVEKMEGDASLESDDTDTE